MLTSADLIRLMLLRLLKVRYLILAGGLTAAITFYFIAKSIPTEFSVRTTVFPLTTSGDNGGSNKLNELLGSGGGMKNLSEEANISLEEVAKSRKTREAVAETRIPSLGNKMIGELLITDYNKGKSFLSKEIKMPKTEADIINTGSAILNGKYVAKPNKNGLIEITFNSHDEKLLSPVCYTLIEKIALFYKELKMKKAKLDYDFTDKKVDSLDYVLNRYDRQQVHLDKTTLFVPNDRIQYTLPKQNLQIDKTRVLAQKTNAAANREEALWRLQKVTPIIEVLDKPEPPFIPNRPSAMIFAAAGFALGCFLIAFVAVYGLVYRYVKALVSKVVHPAPEQISTTTTTA